MQGMSLFNRSQFYRALNLCEPNHCASFRKSDGLRTRFSMSVDEDLQDMTLPPLQHIATSARSHGNDLWVVGDVDIAFTFKDYLLHARSLEQRILCAQRIASNDSCHIFASPGIPSCPGMSTGPPRRHAMRCLGIFLPETCPLSMTGVSEIIREVFYFSPNQNAKNSGGVRWRHVAAPSCTLKY